MEKFGRKYQIVFNIGYLSQVGRYDKATIVDTVIVEYPLTTDFAISRNSYSQVNTGFLTIYGLAQGTREKLYKDRYDVTTYIEVEVRAGYEDGMSLIFKGTVKECQSYKESGGTEYRTEVEAWDGGLSVYKGEDNDSFSADVDKATILETLCQNMPTVKVGAISEDYYNETTLRPSVYTKKTYDELMTITDGNMFIDFERIYFLKENDVIDGNISSLDVSNSLLGSPKRSNSIIKIQVIFEPRVIVGQWLTVTSLSLPYLNGTYKVLGVAHDGTISGAKCGNMITTIDLFIGTQVFRRVEKKNV